MRVWPGRPHPLGASWDGGGVNFALFSEHATGVELCLFGAPHSPNALAIIAMTECTDGVWHAYLPDVAPGALYGYRVDGPWEPERGHRFNRHKLLIDPYAKAVTTAGRWHDEMYGHTIGSPGEDLTMDPRDSARHAPKAVVVEDAFSWGDDRPPRTPWHRTVIYEAHVRGMTKCHPEVPEHLRGTYLGLATDAVIDHLHGLGVTALELLPVHHFLPDRHLIERGLTNYWGYNSIGFFAPHADFATGDRGRSVREFKSMVRALHRAGIEVILDVVYNHTGEGNHLGPTLSMRGVDNATYYRLVPDNPRYYLDFTSVGNSLNMAHPRVVGLVLDSLRYWVSEMHVDGFRFDLAPTLTRSDGQAASSFLDVVRQDPVLQEVKLIAEPWDTGPDGYRLGHFPSGWSEWNGAYRDCVRRFWRGDQGQVPELASRLTGSADIFAPTGRRTSASVNFVTCHDGFTLADLVSYERKHNERNGDDNADGTDHNFSRNWGVEGPTESVRTQRVRDRMRRNLLATLLFSQGVPMLLGGDELGKSHLGNNNPYCQDNELNWLDWDLDGGKQEFLRFVRELVTILHENPVLRRRRFLNGEPIDGGKTKDVTWIRPDGTEMTEDEWSDAHNRTIGMLLFGRAVDDVDSRGRPRRGDSLFVLLNAAHVAHSYALPAIDRPGQWEELLSTLRPGPASARPVRGPSISVGAQSVLLLRHTERPEP